MQNNETEKHKGSGRRSLAAVELFRSLSDEERAALEAQCTWRRYRMGERVFERGSTGREVFLIIEGAVNIVSFSPMGREVSFATAGVGEVVGELAAIGEKPRSASVVASEDSLLAVMPAKPFVELLKRHGELSFALLRRLSEIVRQGDERLLEVSSLEAVNRIYNVILQLAEPDQAVPDLWVVTPLPPLRELASRANTTRELVSNALSRLYPSGLLRRKGDNLYIMDRQALQDLIRSAEDATDT